MGEYGGVAPLLSTGASRGTPGTTTPVGGGGPEGLGQGAPLPEREAREGVSGGLSPPSDYVLPLAGPRRAGESPGRRGGPDPHLAPPRRPRARLHPRGAVPRAGVRRAPSPAASLGGVTGSRGVRRAGERPPPPPPAGGAGPVGEGGWCRGFRRGAGGGAENEWRRPVGFGDPPGLRARPLEFAGLGCLAPRVLVGA